MLTGVDLPTENERGIANACLHDGAILLDIVDHVLVAVVNELARHGVPLVGDQSQSLKLVSY